MWILCIAVMSAVVFTINFLFNETETFYELNFLFIVTGRNIWAIVIAWIVFALHFGPCNKRLGDFMSHRFWMPLGKLTFCIYLTHPVVQYVLTSIQNKPIDYEKIPMVEKK